MMADEAADFPGKSPSVLKAKPSSLYVKLRASPLDTGPEQAIHLL
jgi:hypothetical protein